MATVAAADRKQGTSGLWLPLKRFGFRLFSSLFSLSVGFRCCSVGPGGRQDLKPHTSRCRRRQTLGLAQLLLRLHEAIVETGRADSWCDLVKAILSCHFSFSPAKGAQFCAVSISLCSPDWPCSHWHNNSSVHNMIFGQLGICLGRMSPSQMSLCLKCVLFCFVLASWLAELWFVYLFVYNFFCLFILWRSVWSTGSFRKNEVQ